MVAVGGIECELEATIQITKITRPLLSVMQITKHGDITVVCKKDEAVILNAEHQVLAVFKRKAGVYVAAMKVRNPTFKLPFGGPVRYTSRLQLTRPPPNLKRWSMARRKGWSRWVWT